MAARKQEVSDGDLAGGTAKGAAQGYMLGGPWGALAGGAVGLGSGLIARGQAKKQNRLNAANIRFSNYSNPSDMQLNQTNLLNDVLAGTRSGIGMQQDYESAASENAMRDAQAAAAANQPGAIPVAGQPAQLQFTPNMQDMGAYSVGNGMDMQYQGQPGYSVGKEYYQEKPRYSAGKGISPFTGTRK